MAKCYIAFMSEAAAHQNVVPLPGLSPAPGREPADLRGELATLDHELTGLLLRRMDLVAALADRGEGLRPGRDVAVARRLRVAAPRHAAQLVDVWRAIEGASLAAGTHPYTVIACAPTDPLRMADLARRHFGPAIRLQPDPDPRVTLGRVAGDPRTLAVLPWPGPTGGGWWWTMLRERAFADVRVIAALPLLADTEPEACVVASGMPAEAVGGDHTLILCDDDRADAAQRLAEAGFAAEPVVRARHQALFRVEGHLAPEDPRLAALSGVARASLDVVRLVGTYARV